MKHQIKRLFIASACLVFSVAAKANNTSCEWSHAAALTQDVQTAQDLLTSYGTCKTDCQDLEAKLNSRVNYMGSASACAPHINNRNNREMISFIGSRFNLIKKQKHGYNSFQVAKKPQAAPQVAARPSTPPPAPVVISQRPPVSPPQTTMEISQEAYAALWLDDVPSRAAPAPRQAARPTPQVANTQAAAQAKHQATQQQRQQIQLRKQAKLQQIRLQEAYAKQRQLQIAQNQERQRQRMIEQKRAREAHWEKQRIRQQEMARARAN